MSTTADPLTPMQYPNFRVAYPDIAAKILTYGSMVAPRGLMTKELLGVSFAIQDSTDMLAYGVGRKLNTRFAAADAAEVIGGFVDHEWTAQFNKRILNYGSHGAYGPRIADQMQQAIERLRIDPNSRRAVVQIWSPEKDLFYGEDATDYPCTTEFQFMIRNGRLDIHVDMRANDVLFGTPHDVFTFSQLQCTVANILGIDPGWYYHHATSLHAYEKDWSRLSVLAPDFSPARETRPTGFGQKDDSWLDVMSIVEAIAYSDDLTPFELTESEQWYAQKLTTRKVD